MSEEFPLSDDTPEEDGGGGGRLVGGGGGLFVGGGGGLVDCGARCMGTGGGACCLDEPERMGSSLLDRPDNDEARTDKEFSILSSGISDAEFITD